MTVRLIVTMDDEDIDPVTARLRVQRAIDRDRSCPGASVDLPQDNYVEVDANDR